MSWHIGVKLDIDHFTYYHSVFVTVVQIDAVKTTLKGIKEILFMYFLYFSSSFKKNLVQWCVFKNLLSDRGFHENWHSESHVLLRGINEFCLYFPHLLSCLGEIQYTKSANNGC